MSSTKIFSISEKDISRLNSRLQQYNQVMRRSASKVVETHSKLFVKECMNATAPATKQQGENRVAKDIINVVTPFDASFLENIEDKRLQARIRNLVAKKDIGALQAIFNRIPGLRLWRLIPFDPTLHEQNRIRGDRLRTSNEHNLTLDVRSEKRYIKLVQSRVGKLKASFLPLANALGVHVPSWVARHDASTKSTAEIKLTGDNPHVRLEIGGHYLGYLRRVIDFFLPKRREKMIKDLEFQIRYNKTHI